MSGLKDEFMADYPNNPDLWTDDQIEQWYTEQGISAADVEEETEEL